MTRPSPTLILSFAAAIAMTSGCTKKSPQNPVTKPGSPPELLYKNSAMPDKEIKAMNWLERRYFERWNTLKPFADVNRHMVHQAMPGEDHVALWYSWPRGPEGCEDRAKGITLKINGSELKGWTHRCIQGFKTGRVELRDLKPGTTYNISMTLGKESTPVTLQTSTRPRAKTSTPSEFSFLAFSCNKPFFGLRPGILARDMIAQRLMEKRAKGEVQPSITQARPKFVMGLGDNIYVDPDAGYQGELLTFFIGPRTGRPLLDLSKAREFLDVVYRYVFGMPMFDQTMRHLPSAMTWDDHEIRDGWGSQGDEQQKVWQDYFKDARDAFLAYQVLRNPSVGPMTWKTMPQTKGELTTSALDALKVGAARTDLFSQWSWGAGAKFFMMDLRSSRDESKGRVISENQWEALEQWFSQSPKEKPMLFVLGSSLPLTEGLNGREVKLPPPNSPSRDDMADKWSSPSNNASWRRMIKMITTHFRAHPKHRLLVLSGDVHRSGVHYLKLRQEGGDRIFGHEVNASGLSNSSKARPTNSLLRTTQEEILESDDAILSITRGIINHTPNFAEIVVKQPDPNKVPELGVVFYVSTTSPRQGTVKLANMPSSAAMKPAKTKAYDYSPSIQVMKEKMGTYSTLYIPLKYGATAPVVRCKDKGKSQEVFDVMHAQSVACQTDVGVDTIANHWELVLDPPPKCVTPVAPDASDMEPCR